MKIWLKRGAALLALAFLILSFTNASWIAPEPKGAPKLIAHRGLAQDFDRAGVERDTCTATRIEQPFHPYLENTVDGVVRAQGLGNWMAEVDIAPTSDGEIVLFHDWTLDCRTDGSGQAESQDAEREQGEAEQGEAEEEGVMGPLPSLRATLGGHRGTPCVPPERERRR